MEATAILTDNAENIVRAVEIMGLLHIGCFAHLSPLILLGFFFNTYIQFTSSCSKKPDLLHNFNALTFITDGCFCSNIVVCSSIIVCSIIAQKLSDSSRQLSERPVYVVFVATLFTLSAL